MPSCVCAKCKNPWEMSSSPAICPVCKQASFAIAIPEENLAMKKRAPDSEHRAKVSAAMKKRWQNPEYRAKMSAAIKKRGQDPEYRAKLSAAAKERYQDPEYRAKMKASHSKEP